MALTPRSVFRYYETDGVPASGPHKPKKNEVVQLLEQMQSAASAPAVVKPTKAALDLVTPANEAYGGMVLNDPDPTKNGYYYRSGGAWVKGRGFPDTFAKVTLSGSGSAQTGIVEAGVNPAEIEVYYAFVGTENAGPLTLSVGGEGPRQVVNLAGNPLSAGEWAGVVLFSLSGDGEYQLLIDAGAAASAAQSAADAEKALDDLLLRYLGAYATDAAATDAAGTPSVGQLYWNTTDGKLKAWGGSAWAAADGAIGDGDVTFQKLSAALVQSDGDTSPDENAEDEIPTAKRVLSIISAHMTPQGRLSLATGNPCPESDMAGQTTIYYVPAAGIVLPVRGADAILRFHNIEDELIFTLDANVAHAGYHQSGKNFDIFAVLDGTTVRFGSGPAWSSDTSRGPNGLSAASGLLVNAVAFDLRYGSASGDVVAVAPGQATYLGSFRTVGDGLVSDTREKRFLFNAYNQTLRPMRKSDSRATWTYSTNAYRQMGDDAANQIEFLLGLTGTMVSAVYNARAYNSAGATVINIRAAIGLDSTTTQALESLTAFVGANNSSFETMVSSYRGYPGVGYHRLVPLEQGGGGTTVWQGASNDATADRTGILGEVLL